MQALRGGRSALQLLAQPCSLQISNLSSLASLGSWWQGSATPTATSAAGVSLQRLAALWPALLPSPLSDSQWLAVPKHKVSRHRKGKRSANKYIRFVPVVAQCSKCERIFQQNSLPSKCDEDECPAFTLRARPDAA
ncbi:hypothetical protein D9Q98_005027 [Chlorella vulgaris]|uniref:Uncharacterized protein n=1 Tax=Chlorella vulgaris TaxID=3077 RepID=A0A9D4TNC4_CHLVU|nr:hypothetical protein D9Q98_005027 [Chlorella vulgaris]